MNYGFIAPQIVPEDYVTFGATQLPKEILQENMDWRGFLPVFEHQRKLRLETQGCVSFGENSACEMIYKRRYGTEPNYSDRKLAKDSETTPYGNNPKKVAEAARKKGLVKEESWPWKSGISWDEYYSPISWDVEQEGQKWLLEHTFGYEWVFTSGSPSMKHIRLKGALKYGPIGVSVHAWVKNNSGVYIKPEADNHWCVLVAYDEWDRPVIFDSYEEDLKTLEKNYDFGFAMRYHLLRNVEPPKPTYHCKLWNWIFE